MQFKHPEFLYFLAVLIIPILVHLFQLRRFKKVPFTNVAFLQQLVIKNRKSSQLKKWLILFTRMLILTALVLAFAQPYFSNSSVEKEQETFIYLDNSLSTNTKGNTGNLLKTAAQEIIDNISENGTYTLLTNTNFYEGISANELKNILKKVKYTPKNTSIEEILLKLSQINTSSEKILISDFQNIKSNAFSSLNTPVSLVQLAPEQKNNLSIDSLFVTKNTANSIVINAKVQNQGVKKQNIPIALYNGDKLLSKQTFSIEKAQTKDVSFSVEKSNPFKGKITINHNDAYSFDNTFYFSLNSNEKINVLAIGTDSGFLERIYTPANFNFTSSSLQNTNYNNIDQQQLIILNELEKIPQSLISTLFSFTEKGGHLIIIPNADTETSSYNNLLSKLKAGKILSRQKDSLKITNINFDHPLLKNVFDKKVRNFQYPSVNTHYSTKLINESTIVAFENNTGFIKQILLPTSKIYWVASPLNTSSSNFINSPLIVPIFYNIGQQSIQLSQPYYTVLKENTIDVNIQLNKDHILSIQNNNEAFIPLQQTFQNKVSLHTQYKPEKAGFYNITQEKNNLETIAFNYNSLESQLNFLNLKNLAATNKNIIKQGSVKQTLKKINNLYKVHWLWKWFLAIAIVSLLLEILILKYVKV